MHVIGNILMTFQVNFWVRIYRLLLLCIVLYCIYSCHTGEGQSGGSRVTWWCRKSWYYYQWMDGILSVLWIYVKHSHLCKRQVAGKCIVAVAVISALQCHCRRLQNAEIRGFLLIVVGWHISLVQTQAFISIIFLTDNIAMQFGPNCDPSQCWYL